MGLFSEKLARKANDEFSAYSGATETRSPLRERIGQYWDHVQRPELDGGDSDVPWSAAFISFMVYLAGAGSQFSYSAQHSVYFYRTINDKLTKRAKPFWGYRPEELTIAPGDILGMNRETAQPIDYHWAAYHADYASHSDIVVEVGKDGAVHTIGGNVANKVGKKTFVWDGASLQNKRAASQKVFVVIRSALA